MLPTVEENMNDVAVSNVRLGKRASPEPAESGEL